MKLTNQQVEDAAIALEQFNPAVNLETKLRLARNLRKLTQKRQDKEHDRVRLAYSVISDKTKRPENPNQQLILTAEEQIRLQPEFRALMEEEVEVEIHPVHLVDSEVGQQPTDKWFIDVSKCPIRNEILAPLTDIVFIEAP